MHFYWQRPRISPPLIQFTSGSIVILLLFAMFLGYFHSVQAVDATAPGEPGTAIQLNPVGGFTMEDISGLNEKG